MTALLQRQSAALATEASATRLKPNAASIRREIANCPDNIRRLRQDRVLERRVIRAERVRRGHAPHRSVQLAEKFVRNARCDFRAVAPRAHILVRDDHAVRLASRSPQSLPNRMG